MGLTSYEKTVANLKEAYKTIRKTVDWGREISPDEAFQCECAIKDALSLLEDGLAYKDSVKEHKKPKWERHGCVKKPTYDPTTDLYAYAHRCTACGGVSFFPVGFPDRFCRKCGEEMKGATQE